MHNQSGDSSIVSFPLKSEGRVINYEIGDDRGNINEEMGKKSLIFHGSEVVELKKRLEEETGIEDVTVCTRNPLNEKFCPLQLHLPPNNTTMHIIVVPNSSLGTKNFSFTTLLKFIANCYLFFYIQNLSSKYFNTRTPIFNITYNTFRTLLSKILVLFRISSKKLVIYTTHTFLESLIIRLVNTNFHHSNFCNI